MLGLLFAAAVATAPVAAAPHAAARPADPIVCHNEAIEGSRIPHRVCLRASEAAQLRRDARWLLDRAQAVSPTPNMATLAPMGPRH